MLYGDCGCVLDVCCATEDVGFIRIKATEKNGDVFGLFKDDVAVRGLRFACGLTWYGGDHQIGAFVDREGEYVDVIRVDAADWFDDVDITDYHVALVNAIDVGDYKVYVAAVAYKGASSFSFASRIYDISSVWHNADIVLPEHNSFCNNGAETETRDGYEYSKVTTTRIVASTDSARETIYKQIKTDLELLDVDTEGDFYDAFGMNGEIWYLTTDKSVISTNGNGIDLSGNIDLSNVYSNYLVWCWSPSSIKCMNVECDLLNNGTSKLCVPTKGGQLFVSLIDGDTVNAGDAFAETSWSLAWTDQDNQDYTLTMSLTEHKKFSFNSPDKNLVEYGDFIIPYIPDETLAGQTEEINAIMGISKVITYTLNEVRNGGL